jgi:hypothetical protein
VQLSHAADDPRITFPRESAIKNTLRTDTALIVKTESRDSAYIATPAEHACMVAQFKLATELVELTIPQNWQLPCAWKTCFTAKVMGRAIEIDLIWTAMFKTREKVGNVWRGGSITTSSTDVGRVGQHAVVPQSTSAPEQPGAEKFQEIESALKREKHAKIISHV